MTQGGHAFRQAVNLPDRQTNNQGQAGCKSTNPGKWTSSQAARQPTRQKNRQTTRIRQLANQPGKRKSRQAGRQPGAGSKPTSQANRHLAR